MSDHGEAGYSLISVMLLVVLVVAMANVMCIRTSTVARDTVRERGELRAGYAAEAGLAKARLALRQDPDWRGGELRVADCDVVVTVQVLAVGSWQVDSRAIARPAGRLGVRVACLRSAGIRVPG